MSNFSIDNIPFQGIQEIFLGCYFFAENGRSMTVILTKRYFKNFQYGVVGFCVFAAALVGSIQTAFIIREVGKAKKTGRKQEK